MKMFRSLGLFAAAVLAISVPAAAHAASPYVDAHVGTGGYGVGVAVPVSDHWLVKADYSTFNYHRSITKDGANYSGRVSIGDGGLYAQYTPWKDGWFHLTGGVVAGDRSLSATAKPTSNVTINGNSYTPAQVGTLNAKLKMATIAPYLGLGGTFQWNHVMFAADLGAIIGGRPSASLTSSGGGVSKSDLQAEAHKVSNLPGVWPVAEIGVGFAF